MLRIIVLAVLCHACTCKVGRWDVFSSKTLYDWAHGAQLQQPVSDQATFFIPVNGNNVTCNAVHVNMLVRHGARFPSPTKTRKISYLHQRLLQFESGPLYKDLAAWDDPYTMEKSNQLSPIGHTEQMQLGERFGQLFQDLFVNHGKHAKFVSSTKARALESSRSFFYGIQNAFRNLDTHNIEINDALMRFYDNCENFDSQIKGNAVHFKEAIVYETRPEFLKIQEALKSRLGVNHILPPPDVYLIYEMCAYETSIKLYTFWCDLITDEERVILEYGRDLQEYYARSYGHEINSKLACPLVSDMFHTMDTVIKSMNNLTDHNDYLAGKFQFGHLGTILRLMTSLGLFDDKVPLRANNRAALANRQFRTSLLAPYSANLAFALYSCGESEKNYMLKLLVNEKPVTIPGCQGEACPYDHVRRLYSQLIDRCSISEVCTQDESPDTSPGAGSTVQTSFVTILASFILGGLVRL